MNNNKGFCMFFDWVEDLDYLPAEDAWKVTKALANYFKNGVNPVENGESHLKFALSIMFHQIKRQEEQSETNRRNILKRKNKTENSNSADSGAELGQTENNVRENKHLVREDEPRSNTDTDTDLVSNSNMDTDNKNTNSPQNKEISSSKDDGCVVFSDSSCNSCFEEGDFGEKDSKQVTESDGSGKPSKDYSELFRLFWEEYPRKVGKARAEKCFIKLKPDRELVDKMISAVKTQKNTEQWKKEGGQFIPHPSTWLERGQWEDVVEINNNENITEVNYGTDNNDFRFNYGELCL